MLVPRDFYVREQVRKLREADGEPLLHTVRGVGYVFQRESPE